MRKGEATQPQEHREGRQSCERRLPKVDLALAETATRSRLTLRHGLADMVKQCAQPASLHRFVEDLYPLASRGRDEITA